MNSFQFSALSMGEALSVVHLISLHCRSILEYLHCKYTELLFYQNRHFQRDLVTNPESVLNSVYLHCLDIVLAYVRVRVCIRACVCTRDRDIHFQMAGEQPFLFKSVWSISLTDLHL